MTLVLPPVEVVDYVPYHRGRTARDPLDKPFIAWDGEGITPDGQTRQHFVLFGNSAGYSVEGRKLSTDECLALILTTEQEHPNAIHVGFSFGYDVEMMLCDLPIRHLEILKRKGHVIWHGYRIEFKRSKWFQISKRVRGEQVAARIWDVWGFFQSSFVAAIKDNIGNIPELARIEAGKSGRKQFSYDELDSGYIREYWKTELDLTVKMMNNLRERLYAADLTIRQWHGPGAIATYAFRTRGMAAAMNHDIPEQVNTAAQYAYAGGRFELFRVGHTPDPVYAYDIRSAYPSAIVDLPDLSNGSWFHNPDPDPAHLARFGVYRIRFTSPAVLSDKPMPYFYRDPRYAIHFPNVVEGWYWTPEAQLAAFMPNDAHIIEGWEYGEDGTRPFAWVRDVYETRAQWKRDGNPSQMALKLLLNSLYGKMAQRVGWEAKGSAPTWHQLEWAGFVTSTARAKIFRAMLLAYGRRALIGVETDGIFSAQPLPLDIGPGLGQWEAETYDAMIYLQSGFYFKRNGEEWTAKYRGFDKASVSQADAMRVLREWEPWTGEAGTLHGTTTRFATMGAYLAAKEPERQRNTWTTSPRSLVIGGDGKRIHRHNACPQCVEKVSPADAMHTTTVSKPIGGMSLRHSLPWLHASDPNPYREKEREYGYDGA